MAMVYARNKEDIESLLKRFKLAVEKDGILNEIKEREYFRSPSYLKHKAMSSAKYKKRLAKKNPEGIKP